MQGHCFSLRPFRKGDEEQLIHLMKDKEIHNNTGRIPYPYTMKAANMWLDHCSKVEQSKEAVEFAITQNDEVIGAIGCQLAGENPEIGYWLGKQFWGKGITSEAVSLMIKHLFKHTDLQNNFATALPQNLASIRVLQKNGFAYERHIKRFATGHNKEVALNTYRKYRVQQGE